MSSPSTIVYIGSLPFEWSEENLKAVVCGLGTVLDVRLGFDHVGKNKGYAFVEFESPQSAHNAIQTLNRVQVYNQGSRQMKKLRIELSKEGFRTGNNEHKTVIPLNAAHLPPGVQFPPEVLAKHPELQHSAQARPSHVPDNLPKPPTMHSPAMQQHGNVRINSPAPGAVPPNMANTIPDQYLRASQALPQVARLPFETPDKINETLSHIPPAQLIELIANLKNILSSSNASRAADVFQLSPQLAATASQALLLMGFIDEGVIQEAMQVGSAMQTAPAMANSPAPMHHNANFQGAPQYGQNYGQQGYYQNYDQQSHAQSQSTGPPRGFGQHPPKPKFGHNPGLPPHPAASANAQSRWPHLPPHTQMKLSSLPNDQAELIAQVLTLTNEQISALPPDRQSMVAGLRQQYL